MSDFDLLDNLILEYNKDSSDDEIQHGCMHLDVNMENGVNICTTCGEEIDRPISYSKDWGYYSAGSGRSDPTRVHARKVEEKTISKDVVGMNFSDRIVSKANDIYMECTKGQIYRGGSRKAIIFACIFHAYKIMGNHQTPDSLIQAFGITRKSGLKGMKMLNVNIPKDSEIHNARISPSHIIGDIMNKFAASEAQIMEVCEIYDRIYNRSSKLNRARPQSVAAAVVYYWINTKNIPIDIKEFATDTNLSELTIKKNTKEVEKVISNIK
jgi:transcription initiation factor TFIIIB Brf1 subunit/transcription initiation factor TFIIB